MGGEAEQKYIGQVKEMERIKNDVKTKDEEVLRVKTEYSKRRKIYEDVVNAKKRKIDLLHNDNAELEESLRLKNDKEKKQEKKLVFNKEEISRLEEEARQMKHAQEETMSQLNQMRKEREQEQEFLQQVQIESNAWYRELQSLKWKHRSRTRPVPVFKIVPHPVPSLPTPRDPPS